MAEATRRLGFRRRLHSVQTVSLLLLFLITCMACQSSPHALPTAADEIKYSFGDTPDSVVFNWHGGDSTLYYGPTSSYGEEVAASPSAITPQNGDGAPYLEAVVTGLTPGRVYHYRIGPEGRESTFQTAPVSDFTWVDVGDTMSTDCHGDGSWMRAEHELIAAQKPAFVTHGGDIAVPNQCGKASLHQYFIDQQRWSERAAFQPVWGDHEWEGPLEGSPPDALVDSNSNYKGRVFLTHAQSSPSDRPTKTNHPGCGETTNSETNTCLGEDWGWFRAGRVLFISYPENAWHSWSDWRSKADELMASAQSDPSVDFIVTYGHRPPFTSSTIGPNLDARRVTQLLAAKYSPTKEHPRGKYVVSIGHHAHSMEAFRPIGGLTYLINAAGGQGLTNFVDNIDPRSVFRAMHFGLVRGSYDAQAHSLNLTMLCGPTYRYEKSRCVYGSPIWAHTFKRPPSSG